MFFFFLVNPIFLGFSDIILSARLGSPHIRLPKTGIYTDMDNSPGPLLNETTITDDIDAFFLQEKGGFLSQYFFAIAPKHPLMFLAVHGTCCWMEMIEFIL